MRLVSLLVTMVVASVITFYVLTCSVNNAPPAPVHPIVGKWQMVRSGNNFSVGTYPNTTEYTSDGRRTTETTNCKHGHFRREGTYVVSGSELCLTHYGQPHSIDGEHHCVIVVLDAHRLILRSVDNEDIDTCEYVRVYD